MKIYFRNESQHKSILVYILEALQILILPAQLRGEFQSVSIHKRIHLSFEIT